MKGTRQYQRFCPVDLTTVRVHELSEDREGKVVKASRQLGTDKVDKEFGGLHCEIGAMLCRVVADIQGVFFF